MVVTLLSGTLFYRQAKGWSLLDSLNFSVITLTTVGYGDLTPLTAAASKVFTIFYIFVGIGIILAFVNAVAPTNVPGAAPGGRLPRTRKIRGSATRETERTRPRACRMG